MKWLFFVLVLPLLGGCLAQMPGENPSLSVNTVQTPNEVVDKAIEAPSAPVAESDSRQPLFKPEFDNLFADQSGISFSLLDFYGLFASDDEIEIDEPGDSDDLADRLILSGVDEDPPADEGTTVVADEVVFDFPVVENEKVHYYVDYYSGPAKKIFTRWLERSSRYLPLMQKIFAEEGLPLDLVYLALVESGFNNRAYSWAHAAGPWQFIRSTGALYGMKNNWWYDERRDFEKATRSAARFLRELRNQFNGDWYLAIAAYNAGPGKIQRAIEMYDTHDFWEISRHPYLATETKNYVPKLLASLLIAKQPEKYGLSQISYQEPLAFDLVTLPGTTDLEVVAKICNSSYEEIRDLNPELSRWCTPPNKKNYLLRIPAGKKDTFEELFAQVPANERVNYHTHRVRKGDTLKSLAKKFNIRANDIVAMNSLAKSKSLKVGTDLILPLRKGSPIPLQELIGPPSESSKKTYTVRKGDTLRGISRKFDVSEKELKSWNRIANVKLIKPGQVLTLSAKGAKSTAKARNDGNRIVYKVKSGDTLFGIADNHGVTVEEIVKWNGISRRHVLRPGEKLTLSQKKTVNAAKKASASSKRKITYKVRPGDTLWEISRRFDVATRQIIEWNKLAADEVLQPGAKLTLMVADGKG